MFKVEMSSSMHPSNIAGMQRAAEKKKKVQDIQAKLDTVHKDARKTLYNTILELIKENPTQRKNYMRINNKTTQITPTNYRNNMGLSILKPSEFNFNSNSEKDKIINNEFKDIILGMSNKQISELLNDYEESFSNSKYVSFQYIENQKENLLNILNTAIDKLNTAKVAASIPLPNTNNSNSNNNANNAKIPLPPLPPTPSSQSKRKNRQSRRKNTNKKRNTRKN